jgi:hypothetical protein
MALASLAADSFAVVAALRLCHGTGVKRATWVLAAALIGAGPLAAHHGASAYNLEQTVTVTGTVTEFQFVNPHVLIYVATTDADGRERVWAGELTSPNRMARLGGAVKWHKDLLKPGDVVTLTGRPARNGAPALLLTAVQDSDGAFLTGTGR